MIKHTKNKVTIISPIILLLFFGVLITGGCGNEVTSTDYGYPNWTYDGRITACKKTTVSKSSMFSGSDFTEYSIQTQIVIMDEDGSDESVLLNDIESPSFMSPDNNYIEAFGKIYAMADKSVVHDIDNDYHYSGVQSCGWAPSENGHIFVYVVGLYVPDTELRLVDIDQSPPTYTLVTTNAEYASWMYGDRIYFQYLASDNIHVMDGSILADGSDFQDYRRKGVACAQVFALDNTKIYGVGIGVPYGVYDIDDPDVSPNILLNEYSGYDPRLHLDGDRILDSYRGWGIRITRLITGITTWLK